jgi:hypothetical protein
MGAGEPQAMGASIMAAKCFETLTINRQDGQSEELSKESNIATSRITRDTALRTRKSGRRLLSGVKSGFRCEYTR